MQRDREKRIREKRVREKRAREERVTEREERGEGEREEKRDMAVQENIICEQMEETSREYIFIDMVTCIVKRHI